MTFLNIFPLHICGLCFIQDFFPIYFGLNFQVRGFSELSGNPWELHMFQSEDYKNIKVGALSTCNGFVEYEHHCRVAYMDCLGTPSVFSSLGCQILL